MAYRAARRLAPATRCLSLALLAWLLALCPLVAPASAQTQQDAQKTAEQVIRRLDLQTELPREPEPTRFTIKLPSEVLWLVVAVAIGVLLYAFRDLLLVWRPGREGAWNTKGTLQDEAEANAPAAILGAADELAAEGRFAEAMHVLLLRGLADIRRGLGEEFADSLTSREILRSARLPELGQSSLRDIVSRVERTYFGEYPATPADYADCRASFNLLLQALAGRVTA